MAPIRNILFVLLLTSGFCTTCFCQKVDRFKEFWPIDNQTKLDSFLYYAGIKDTSIIELSINCNPAFGSIELKPELLNKFNVVRGISFNNFNSEINTIIGLKDIRNKESDLRLSFNQMSLYSKQSESIYNSNFYFLDDLPNMFKLKIFGYDTIFLPYKINSKHIFLAGNFIKLSSEYNIEANFVYIFYPNIRTQNPSVFVNILDSFRILNRSESKYRLFKAQFNYIDDNPKFIAYSENFTLEIHTNSRSDYKDTLSEKELNEMKQYYKQIALDILNSEQYSYLDMFIYYYSNEINIERVKRRSKKRFGKQRVTFNSWYHPEILNIDDLCELSSKKKLSLSFYFNKESKNFDPSLFDCFAGGNAEINIYVNKKDMDPKLVKDFIKYIKKNNPKVKFQYSKIGYLIHALYL